MEKELVTTFVDNAIERTVASAAVVGAAVAPLVERVSKTGKVLLIVELNKLRSKHGV